MKRLLPMLLATAFSAAVAAPTAPVVVNGTATFSQQGNVFTITNTPNTIINWQSFSVAPGEVTRFVQQSANSAVLNRILGQDPSQILGALQSNGQVFLINPNGVMFGQGARIDVAGLTASTLNMTDADFLAGRNKFSAGPVAGNVSNQGSITTPAGGHVFLVAPNVENTGIITSPKGEVVLAAGHQVQLVDSRDPDVYVVVSAPENKAVNLGQVISHGGRIGIYGGLVNQRGVVNANSAVVGENGKIVLRASGDTLLEAGSTTSATGAGNGGAVHVLGKRVGMTGNASIDVSGATGGGTVLMGGDYRGGNPLYGSAEQTWMGKDASIRADAGASGKGGKVILWALGATRAFGAISARGGASAGDGGFIETSADYLDVNGLRIDTGAVNGRNGLWLLDPMNITVGLPSCLTVCVDIGPEDAAVFDRVPDVSGLISVATLLGVVGDIRLEAKNHIRFNDVLDVGSRNLTALAGGSIDVDAPLSTDGGNIVLHANNSTFGATGNGAVNVNQAIHSNGGNVTLEGASVNVGAGIDSLGGDIALKAEPLREGAVTINGPVRSGGGYIALSGPQLTIGAMDPSSVMAVDSAGGSIDLTADSISMSGGVMAGPSSGASSVTIRPLDSSLPIWIGGTPEVDALSLSNNELGQIYAGQITIGGYGQAGDINWGLVGIYEQASSLSFVTTGKATFNNLLELRHADGMIDVIANAVLVTGSGSIKAPNVVLMGEEMQIDGAVYGTGSINLIASEGVSRMAIGTTAGTAPFALDDTEVANLHTRVLNFGDSGQQVDMVLGLRSFIPESGAGYSLDSPGLLVLDSTAGSIHVVDKLATTASVLLEAPGGIRVGDMFDETVSSSGTSTAGIAAHSINLQAGTGVLSMSRGTTLDSGSVIMVADTMHIEQGASIGQSGGTVTIAQRSNFGDIELGSSALDSGVNETEALRLTNTELGAVKSSRLVIGDYGWTEAKPGTIRVKGSLDLAGTGVTDLHLNLGTGGLFIGEGATLRANQSISVDSVTGDPTDAGEVMIDGLLEAVDGTVSIDARSVRGTGLLKGAFASLIAREGIYGAGMPGLVTASTTGGEVGPFNTQVAGLWAENDSSGETATPINIRNNFGASGGYLQVNGLYQYGDGSISLQNYGALGIREDSGRPTVEANGGAVGIVTDSSMDVNGTVATTSGSILLEAGATATLTVGATAAVQSGTGDITLQAGTLNVSADQITTSGVKTLNGTVVSGPPPGPTLSECLANSAISGCAAVLDAALDACIADDSGSSCDQVLPSMAACIADEYKKGCSVVLPTLEACLVTPTAEGCSVVLPTAEECVQNPNQPGCVTSTPPAPTLEQCVANPGISGCDAVLPDLAQCVADKTTPGCEAVLPDLAQCVADKTAPGCEAVLPNIAACIADKATPGCEVILPNMSACIADKTAPGCEVILPSMAQCVSAPTLGGCSVVLPKLEQCAVNPNQAGCEAVLPRPDFCSTHPTDPRCVVFNPAPGDNEKNPVAEAVQTTVTLVNSTSKLGQGKSPGTGESQGSQEGEPEKPGEKEQGTPAPENTGAKNEKPATKLYCN